MWGVVKDANTGTPIGGATVSYVDSNGQTGITTTDASGIYAFDLARGPVPAAGNVNLGVNAAGIRSADRDTACPVQRQRRGNPQRPVQLLGGPELQPDRGRAARTPKTLRGAQAMRPSR